MTSTTTGPMGPGTVLAGRYRLEDLLTESSGARFWRATDTVLARNVAVHAVASSDDRAGDLMEAARLSATVNDSHLLRVLDCDDAEGVCWVVHEWGEGLSLDLMLERGPLAPARAAWLAQEVAAAIAAGHAQGVTHGRLNPEAVLVTHSGAVKLIGYVIDAALHDPVTSHPVYGEVDAHQSDVLGVAGVLYAALTGRWPGVAPSDVATAPVEGHRPLRPRQVRAGVPRSLDAICERVLHREGSRHDSPLTTAHEVAAALADITGGAVPGGPGAMGPDALHDDPTTVISRAALAEEARLRDPEQEPDGPDQDPEQDPGGPATGDLEATQAAPAPTQAATPAATQVAEPAATSRGRTVDPVPVPPRYEDSPDRPLFATTERRVPLESPAGSTAVAGAAATGGSTAVPDYWPVDRESREPPATDDHAGRGWLRAAIVAGLVLATVIAMIVAFSVGRDNGVPGLGGSEDPSQSAAPQGQAIEIADVSDFDPQGSPPNDESPDEVPNAVDGDPATTWSTATYYNRSDLGGLKEGVGLMLDLGSDRDVAEVQVRLAASPTSLEVYAAQQGATSAPSDPEQMELVGGQDDAGERVDMTLDPAPTTRFLLLWLTELPATEGGYRGEVAEVAVRS